MSFKRVFAAAALSLALVTSAFGQAGIQLGAGQVLGNSTAAQRPGRAESVTAILDRALGSTRGAIIERGVAGWAMFSPSATARVPYLSGGTGADPLYGAYTLPASVTSGGVACFTSTTVESSSALLSANAIVLGGGAGVCPSPMGSLGTTTTVLHGNAGGPPTFGAVVSADLSITATNCTNQFVTAISTGGVGTCTTDVLASAQHANQGTTTTVLHGNGAGNPAFGAVVSADLNITTTTCSSQFVSAISSGGIGTCSDVTYPASGTTTTTAACTGGGTVSANATISWIFKVYGKLVWAQASMNPTHTCVTSISMPLPSGTGRMAVSLVGQQGSTGNSVRGYIAAGTTTAECTLIATGAVCTSATAATLGGWYEIN